MNATSESFLNSDVINDDFFIEIVERKLNIRRDDFKLRLVFITPATGSNENFASVVYRAKINIEMVETNEKKVVDVIIKALIVKIERLKEMEIFKREIVMYKDVLESLETLHLERTSEKVEFGPKCIKVIEEPIEVIVLDDLKPEGYRVLERKIGLELEESKLVLAKLAKLHAASAVRYLKDGMISDCLDRLAIMKNRRFQSQDAINKSTASFMMVFQKFIGLIKSFDGFEKIAQKLEKWEFMKIMTTFMGMTEPLQSGFKVLNHGDDWVNNMMFKYDEDGKVSDMKFIDFQLSFWGSPANDIIYFLVSSVKDEVKIDHFDDLIQYYHEELVNSLEKLNYDKPIPSLYEIHVDLLQKGGAFAFHIMVVLMIVKNNSEHPLDITQLFDRKEGSIDSFEDALNNPIYKKAVATWLPFLNKRGYLDVYLPEAPLTTFMKALFASFPKPGDNVTAHAAE